MVLDDESVTEASARDARNRGCHRSSCLGSFESVFLTPQRPPQWVASSEKRWGEWNNTSRVVGEEEAVDRFRRFLVVVVLPCGVDGVVA
jgi:hypothetical protein